MDLCNYQNQSNPVFEHAAIDNNMRFWEGVIAAGMAVDGHLTITADAEVEMEQVGGIISLADGNDNAVVDPVSIEGVVKDIGEGGGGGSSSGSTKNVASLVGCM